MRSSIQDNFDYLASGSPKEWGHAMSRQSSIVYAIIVFAFIFAVTGCSSTPNPTLVTHSGAAGIKQKSPFVGGGSWTVKAPMHMARQDFGVGVVDGLIYAIGETSNDAVEAYNPKTDSWIDKAHTINNIEGAGVVNGKIYAVAGGCNGSIEAYDPKTDTWTFKSAMPKGRLRFGTGVLNGLIYVVGGRSCSGPNPTYEVEIYDPATNAWSKAAGLPRARYGLAVGAVGGKLYAIGGWQWRDGFLNWVDAYDPATNKWTAKADMPTARQYLSIGVIDGILYAVGGWGNCCYETTVEAYDPATDSWTEKAGLPMGTCCQASGVLDGKLYALGGSYSRYSLNINLVYNPK
jgi:N-acetylneuraminic acid mutarotase